MASMKRTADGEHVRREEQPTGPSTEGPGAASPSPHPAAALQRVRHGQGLATAQHIHQLQQHLGNQATLQLLAPSSVMAVQRQVHIPTSGGRALPPAVKARMESALQADFSGVQVHVGDAAQALGAKAFTQGNSIHFAPGEYSPRSRRGQEMLGHELAHVVQQRRRPVPPTQYSNGVAINADPSLEAEADRLGARAAMAHGTPAGRELAGAGSGELSAAASRAHAPIQRVLKLGGKYSQVTDPAEQVELIIKTLESKPSYQELTKHYGASLVKETLLKMAGPGQDHGEFSLTGFGMNGPQKLMSALEVVLKKDHPVTLEELSPHDVVTTSHYVAVVLEVSEEQALIQPIRRITAEPTSREYADDDPELIDRALLKKSKEPVNLQEEKARELVLHEKTGVSPLIIPPSEEAPQDSSPVVTREMIESAKVTSAHKKSGVSRIVPKDLSFKPSAMHMNWAPLGKSEDKAAAKYIEQMALLGRVEGFPVIVLVAENQVESFKKAVSAEALKNIRIKLIDAVKDVWAEDSGDFHTDESIHVPARVNQQHPASPLKTITEARKRREFYLKEADHEDSDISRIGATVSDKSTFRDKVGLGLASETPVYENESHIEGGNILSGTTQEGEGYALVGMDSVDATRALLAAHREVPPSEIDDAQVREAISRDTGIQSSLIFFVEQPGEFHLDMAMVVMGPKQVIVNDCLQVYELQQVLITEDYKKLEPADNEGHAHEAWLKQGTDVQETLGYLKQHAERIAPYEERVVKQLGQHGLHVVRVAGAFPGTKYLPAMNFLNGEGGIGQDNRPFFVTNGGDSRVEKYIAEQYLSSLSTGLARVYFTDPRAAQISLGGSGGLGCRTKGAGTIFLQK